MGNEESILNKEKNFKEVNIKAPEFHLYKNYPINGKKTLKDLIKNYIDGYNGSYNKDNKNINIKMK